MLKAKEKTNSSQICNEKNLDFYSSDRLKETGWIKCFIDDIAIAMCHHTGEL